MHAKAEMELRSFGRAALVVLTILVGGCAGLPSRLDAPTISIADVGLGSVSLFEQQLALKLRIQNPNDADLRVDGIAFALEVNDQPFAQAVGNRGVIVPRYGSNFMTVDAVATLSSFVRQFSELNRGDRSGFRYRIKGTVSLEGTRFPFERQGELLFPWPSGEPRTDQAL